MAIECTCSKNNNIVFGGNLIHTCNLRECGRILVGEAHELTTETSVGDVPVAADLIPAKQGSQEGKNTIRFHLRGPEFEVHRYVKDTARKF